MHQLTVIKIRTWKGSTVTIRPPNQKSEFIIRLLELTTTGVYLYANLAAKFKVRAPFYVECVGDEGWMKRRCFPLSSQEAN